MKRMLADTLSLIVLLGAICCLISCSDVNSPSGSISGSIATTGDVTTLKGNGESVIVALNGEAHDRLLELSVAEDFVGIQQMINAGLVWAVPNGTRCKVISPGVFTYEVRIMEGEYYGVAGIVSSERVSRIGERQSTITTTGSGSDPSHQSSDPLPAGVSYEIIDEYRLRTAKRSLNIRINKRVHADVLKSIAMKLVQSDPTKYDRTFIGYYLPHMNPEKSPYWATTHFTPDLSVETLGFTKEEATTVFNDHKIPSKEIVGSWILESPGMSHRIDIFNDKGKFYERKLFGDGSSGTEELLENVTPRGRRFEEKKANSSGDHYLLDELGQLQIRDDEGLIATATILEYSREINDADRVESEKDDEAKAVSESTGDQTNRESEMLSRQDIARLKNYLRTAKRLIASGSGEAANQYLEAVIDQAPESRFAKEAKDLLVEIDK